MERRSSKIEEATIFFSFTSSAPMVINNSKEVFSIVSEALGSKRNKLFIGRVKVRGREEIILFIKLKTKSELLEETLPISY